MKKVFCILIAFLLLVGCTGCGAVISIPSGTAVEICYDRENVSFDIDLQQEEADVVRSVLNGKRPDLDMTVTGAGCGFGRAQAFVIDDATYCLAQDDCGVIWKEGTNHYYILSDQEMRELKEIFKAHGAKIV